MKFGYLSLNTPVGIRPDVLAREVEARGFESVWLAEHSNIPVSRTSRYGGGGRGSDAPLPEAYLHIMDPFVSLAMAASVTTDLTLATGVCLPLEHDPMALAITTATLDVLSGGRLLLGVGAGWNREEFENHRSNIPWEKRYSGMRERIGLLRTLWRDDEAEFSGTWHHVDRAWVNPKPVDRRIPVALGNGGPTGIKLAAAIADEWCPLDIMLVNDAGRLDVPGRIADFRNALEAAGRDSHDVPITLFVFAPAHKARIEQYIELGATRLVFPFVSPELIDTETTMRHLDEIAPLIEEYAGA